MGKEFEKEYLNHFAIHLRHNTANQLRFIIKQNFKKWESEFQVSSGEWFQEEEADSAVMGVVMGSTNRKDHG